MHANFVVRAENAIKGSETSDLKQVRLGIDFLMYFLAKAIASGSFALKTIPELFFTGIKTISFSCSILLGRVGDSNPFYAWFQDDN